MEILGFLINGVSLGSIYAIIALGYTMVYGIAKMLNFAHGDVIMVGSYVIVLFSPLVTATGSNVYLSLIATVLVAIVFCMALGIVIEKFAYKPLRGASPLAVLITAIGVSYLLQSLVQMKEGSAPKIFTPPDLGNLKIGFLSMSYYTVITLACSIVVMVALSLFVKFSKTGRAMVAVSEDKGAAQLMGINVNGIIMNKKEKYANDYAEFMQYLDEKVLDHVDRMDIRSFILPKNWQFVEDFEQAMEIYYDLLNGLKIKS